MSTKIIPPSPSADDYASHGDRPLIADVADPFALFEDWMAEARKTEPNDCNAMSLATVDAAGMPDVRILLLKEVADGGFVFYTNLESAKGEQLRDNPVAALCFHWKTLRRQVRVRGTITRVSDAEADDYFHSRPRGSRIGAWASKQSRELESRFALEKEVARYAAKFGVGEIPRPDYWSGFRIRPLSIEFWSDGQFRLHDRTRYDRQSVDADWTVSRLYP